MNSPRALSALALAFALAGGGCGGPKRVEIVNVPIGTEIPELAEDGRQKPPSYDPSKQATDECATQLNDNLDATVKGGECDAVLPAGYLLAPGDIEAVASIGDYEVASGGRGEVRIALINKRSHKLPLFFYRAPRVSFPVVVVDSKGQLVSHPPEAEPGVQRTPQTARVVLMAGGQIVVRVPVHTDTKKWQGKGDKRSLVDGKPLPSGEYRARIKLPLAGQVDPSYAFVEVNFMVR